MHGVEERDGTRTARDEIIAETKASLPFYYGQVRYYHGWANRHMFAYWVLTWLGVGFGVSIAVMMLREHKDLFAIAAAALALNSVLLVAKSIGADAKYARYRTTELNIIFALRAFENSVVHEVLGGESVPHAIDKHIDDLHGKIEVLVHSEFDAFFRDMRSLKQLYDDIKKDPAAADESSREHRENR